METETQIRHSVEIDRPPEAVWPWLEEPGKQKRWMKGLLSNEAMSDPPRGLGATFRMKIREGRRVSEYDGEVTAYDKPRRLAVKLTGGCMKEGAGMFADYRLTELDGRRTRLDYACGAEVSGVWRLFMFLFRIFGKMQIKSFFRELKRCAEEEARETVAAR